MKGNMYVDDLFKSLDAVMDVIFIYHEIKELFADSCFIIEKWSFKSQNVVKIISEEDRAPSSRQICMSTEDAPTQGVMGLQWTHSEDMLSLRESTKDIINTKQGILKETHSYFDPLGFTSAFILRGKLINQELNRNIWISYGMNHYRRISPENGYISFGSWMKYGITLYPAGL